MKVAVISTTIMTCPPPGYSGLEMIAWQVAKGLARRGHKVTLIAPIGSQPPEGVDLHGTTLWESEKQAYSGYWSKLPQFDVIIDHSWEKWSYILKAEGNLKAPILGVCHAPIGTMYGSPPPVALPCLVAISKDQASAINEHLGVPARVAYNGIDLDFYKPMKDAVRSTDRYLFLARMSKIKGPHIAVDIARKLRIPLDLVGDDKITGEPQYSQRLLELAKPPITYHGGVSRDKSVEFFSKAKALLHPNKEFREPFGLAPIEAQACGCPVIAFDNGAMRETIKHGETGFLVSTEDEMAHLIKENAVASLKPKRCVEWAAQFSIKAMTDGYERLITEALDTGW